MEELGLEMALDGTVSGEVMSRLSAETLICALLVKLRTPVMPSTLPIVSGVALVNVKDEPALAASVATSKRGFPNHLTPSTAFWKSAA